MVFDYSDVENRELLSEIVLPSLIRKIYISGSYAFVLIFGRPTGLCIVNISDINQPQITGTITLEGVEDIVIVDEYVYAVGEEYGLYVVSISDIDHPELIRTIFTDGVMQEIEYDNDRLFVATNFNDAPNLKIFDITERAEPVRIKTYPVIDNIYALHLHENRAFMGIDDDLVILDVSNPDSISELSDILLDEASATVIQLYNDLLYVVSHHGEHCLNIVDIHDPTNPEVIGVIPENLWVEQIAFNGDIAYCAPGERVIDISDPRNPRFISNVSEGGAYLTVVVNENTAYANEGHNLNVF